MLAVLQLEEDVGAGAFGQGGGQAERRFDDVGADARCGQPDVAGEVGDGGGQAGGMAPSIFRSP